MIKVEHNDGGRKAAGFPASKGGDCVARSIAIASGRPYREVYAALAQLNEGMRKSSRRMPTVGQFTADKGIYISSEIFKRYMRDLGFTWVPTMSIGSGRRVHLRADELPPGRLVVKISRHCSAVIRHARFFARRHALSLRLLEAGVIAREPQKPACEH